MPPPRPSERVAAASRFSGPPRPTPPLAASLAQSHLAFDLTLTTRCYPHSAEAGQPCWSWPTSSGTSLAACGARVAAALR